MRNYGTSLLGLKDLAVLIILLLFRWRSARDAEGRVYYYNTKTRETSWTPPPPAPSSGDNVTEEGGGEEECVEMDTASTDSDDNNGELPHHITHDPTCTG